MNRLEHARRVESVVRGGSAAALVDRHVRASWNRCLSKLPLDPGAQRIPRIVSSSDLRQRRKALQPVYDVARIEMRRLAMLLNAPVGVTLTDHEGVIVSYAGDPRFAEMAYRSGLRDGAVWSESEQGTNGMGTCLALQDAVAIEGDQHFLFQNTALTCCGAPIRDGQGRLIGVLNMSGQVRLSTAPTLALARLAAQNVENRALLQRHAHDLVVRFHPHRVFIGAAGEGILAVDDRGRVKAANPAALEWLHLPDHGAVIGQPIADVLGVDSKGWRDWPTHPGEASRLPIRALGSVCFGVVQLPLDPADVGRGRADRAGSDPPDTSPGDDPDPGVTRTNCPFCATRSGLRASEHRILSNALESCRWNVSAAAAALGLSRRTLHRKIRQHALRRQRVGRRPEL